jgi:hypothetical protein
MNRRAFVGSEATGALVGALAFGLGAGCGDLVDMHGASDVAYHPSGDIAAFTPRALMMYSGDLAEKRDSISYGADVSEPPDDPGEEFPYMRTLCAGGTVAAAAASRPISSPTDWPNRRVAVFEVPSGKRLMTLEMPIIYDFQLSPRCDLLAVLIDRLGPYDEETHSYPESAGLLQVYRVSDGALLWEIPRALSRLVFSADGARIFGAGGESLGSGVPPQYSAHLWSWSAFTGEPLFDATTENGLDTLTAVPDGSALLGSVRLSAIGWAFALFGPEDGQLLRAIPQASGFANSHYLAAPLDGAYWVASTMRDRVGPTGTVQLWKSDGTLVCAFDQEVRSVAFAPDGSAFAVVDLDGVVIVYRVPDCAEIARKSFTGDIF